MSLSFQLPFSTPQDMCLFCDRFHWMDHIGCSNGYNISNFEMFKKINTEAAEQAFSCLNRVVGPTSFMTARHFMVYLRTFFHGFNDAKRKSWAGPRARDLSGIAEVLSALKARRKTSFPL
jgi:hypothetical protein